MSKYVIFSVDNADNLHSLSKAMRYLDTVQAMDIGTTIINCVGMCEGKFEVPFICTLDVFNKHVKDCPFVQDQATYLLVEDGHKRIYGSLYTWDGTKFHSGVIEEVSAEEAMSHDGWTYRPDIDKYWVLV